MQNPDSFLQNLHPFILAFIILRIDLFFNHHQTEPHTETKHRIYGFPLHGKCGVFPKTFSGNTPHCYPSQILFLLFMTASLSGLPVTNVLLAVFLIQIHVPAPGYTNKFLPPAGQILSPESPSHPAGCFCCWGK